VQRVSPPTTPWFFACALPPPFFFPPRFHPFSVVGKGPFFFLFFVANWAPRERTAFPWAVCVVPPPLSTKVPVQPPLCGVKSFPFRAQFSDKQFHHFFRPATPFRALFPVWAIPGPSSRPLRRFFGVPPPRVLLHSFLRAPPKNFRPHFSPPPLKGFFLR